MTQVYGDYIGKVDFAMTSPPYFNREMYSDDDNQSYKLGTYEDWRDSFLKPFINEVYTLLKVGGIFSKNEESFYFNILTSLWGLELRPILILDNDIYRILFNKS